MGKTIGDPNSDKGITFNKVVTTYRKISDAFRIFTTGEKINKLPNMRPCQTQGVGVLIATDGSCVNNGGEDARAGAGIFFGENDKRNRAIRIPPELSQTNQVAEMVATKEAINGTNKADKILIKTDLMHIINSMSSCLQKHEDKGYIGKANRELTQALIGNLRRHPKPINLKWVKGHTGDRHKELFDLFWSKTPI
jgi:ribonuclease HI